MHTEPSRFSTYIYSSNCPMTRQQAIAYSKWALNSHILEQLHNDTRQLGGALLQRCTTSSPYFLSSTGPYCTLWERHKGPRISLSLGKYIDLTRFPLPFQCQHLCLELMLVNALRTLRKEPLPINFYKLKLKQ